jgi:hypothetical protein
MPLPFLPTLLAKIGVYFWAIAKAFWNRRGITEPYSFYHQIPPAEQIVLSRWFFIAVDILYGLA